MTDAVLEALWKRVLDDWDDETRHAAFLDACRANGQLLEAAVRYRGMAGDHVRGEAAGKRLKAVSLLAMASLESERSPEPRDATTLVRVVVIVFFAAATGLLAFLLTR